MEIKEIINKITSIEEEIYNYITNTENWLFYWIENKEVQDFIKEYPEDYEDKVHLQVGSIDCSPSIVIKFDSHPNDIISIERYCVLYTFRDTVKAKWLQWNGKVKELQDKVKELQIEEKEEELAYHKKRVDEIEKAILELKNE